MPGEVVAEEPAEGAQDGGVDSEAPGEGADVAQTGAVSQGGREVDGLREAVGGEEFGDGVVELGGGGPARGVGGTGEPGERADIDARGEYAELAVGFEVPAGDRLAQLLVGGVAEVSGAGVPGPEVGEVHAGGRSGDGPVLVSDGEAEVVHGGCESRGVLSVPEPGEGLGVGVEPVGEGRRLRQVVADLVHEPFGVVQAVSAQEPFHVIR